MNILVTDGENRSSLAATRSLGRRGYKVFVSGKEKKNISSVSKYCAQSYAAGDAIKNGDKYIKKILAILDEGQVNIVLPMAEPTIFLLNEYRQLLPKSVVLACPETSKIDQIFNKYELFQHAKKLGVPIPKTVFINSCEEFASKERQLPEFPLVVKPGMSRIRTESGFLQTTVMFANNLEELRTLYKREEALKYPSLIQEKITGPGTGLFTLFNCDKHLALFSHERIREKPPWGGVSVVCQSVPLDDKMVESASKLLSAVEWKGVAMVEFKRDLRDSTAKLMEINGRFWGSLQLAIASGVDFPNLLIDFLTKKKLDEPARNYFTGYKLKWILGTLDHLLICMKKTHHELYKDQGEQSRVAALLKFLKVKEKDTSFDVLDTQDIRPFLFELKDYVKDIVSRR